ncbi:ribosomal protein S12p [Desulfocucumis palustris]|uniref:Ribosomal protein uS12 methylthiotransferase RimO n=1 Tax=Desulfocucumis palustris TaxID=1898651 RepID=A0A2L2X8Z2_9FIRM|nr:30S ribosomal protein S12 methylthiotransferase RimO [Desulfocucumis palustris]GBF32689.1 ribosomal protein S12p [Desulfocucumis palustris]
MASKVGIISLGCSKNLVDTEIMLGLLNRAGYEITGAQDNADVIIVNTCGFITPAKEEAINTIFETARLKETSGLKALLVAGCLSQRYGKILLDEMPEVDGILGTGAVPDIAGLVELALQGERFCRVASPAYAHTPDMPRILTTPPYSAYLKIADGCSNRCSYCAIPNIRGDYRSRPLEAVISEAESLLEQGVREIVLVAQDTTAYGMDIYGRRKLAGLVRELAVLGVPWIRLMYCYPTGFTGELIKVMADNRNICRYVDMPLQHASPRMLKLMNRRGSPEEIKELIAELRRAMPGIALRSTFMVGFPGETGEDFEELISFMKEVRFERAGVFKYSREEGTPAGDMSGQVPARVKEERYHRAMKLQQEISLEQNSALVGKVINVLVEEEPSGRSNLYRGRSEMDAPDIDGLVLFTAVKSAPRPGDLVKVRVNKAYEYDLRGELS